MNASYLVCKTKKNEASKPFLASLLIIGGFYSLIHPLWGVLIFSVAMVFASIRNGLILDIDNHRYKNTVMVGNITFSNWRPLPKCSYLSVFSATMVSSTSSLSGKYMALKNKIIKINLIHDTNRRLTVYHTDNMEDAMEKAQYIAQKLGLRIYNADTKTWETADLQDLHPSNKETLYIQKT